jgi:hypothetical protein
VGAAPASSLTPLTLTSPVVDNPPIAAHPRPPPQRQPAPTAHKNWKVLRVRQNFALPPPSTSPHGPTAPSRYQHETSRLRLIGIAPPTVEMAGAVWKLRSWPGMSYALHVCASILLAGRWWVGGHLAREQLLVWSGGASDEGRDDVVGVTVQVVPGTVVGGESWVLGSRSATLGVGTAERFV